MLLEGLRGVGGRAERKARGAAASVVFVYKRCRSNVDGR